MKMSNVFELPVIVQKGYTGDIGFYTSIVDSNYKEIVGGHVIDEDAAHRVAHCINTHDKLIDLLTYASNHMTIDLRDPERVQWFIDVLELLEDEHDHTN